MRDLKFRAWNGKSMEIIDDLYWFEENHVHENGDGYGCENIIMQFTGLHDKNGKEIYEGDLLKHYPGFGCEWTVRYSQVVYEGASFWQKHKSIAFVLDDHDQHLEVIGNIYENPELLKNT